MAVDIQQLWPLHEARERRRALSRYLNLDRSRYLLGVVVLLGLMSMIALVQTGVVATKGYAIVALEGQITELRREKSQLQMRLAAAQSMDTIRERAGALGLRPMTREQIRYITIEHVSPAAQTSDDSTPAEEQEAAPGSATPDQDINSEEQDSETPAPE